MTEITELEALKERHSVRQYEDRPIEPELVEKLNAKIDEINAESGLHIQLFTNEPGAFEADKPSYGQFSGCKNYFAMVGKNNMDEVVGYYGEKLVLYAQQLGLNTCWVAKTFKKSKVTPQLGAGEKLYIVIALGYGKDQGVAHKSKDIKELCDISDTDPDWCLEGMKAAQLAPTAMNQQKFWFRLDGTKIRVKPGHGFYTKIDAGIAKYNFEVGAGKENFYWI